MLYLLPNYKSLSLPPALSLSRPPSVCAGAVYVCVLSCVCVCACLRLVCRGQGLTWNVLLNSSFSTSLFWGTGSLTDPGLHPLYLDWQTYAPEPSAYRGAGV